MMVAPFIIIEGENVVDMLHQCPKDNMLAGQRVAIFVDVQNMFYAAKYSAGGKLDFAKLMAKIVRGRTLSRAIAYTVQKEGFDQSAFLSSLYHNCYEVKTKTLATWTNSDGFVKKKGDWDMGIAMDSLAVSSTVDVIALVTGDGDFADLVHMLKGNGKKVEVYSFASCLSDSLKQVASEWTILDESVLYNKPGDEDEEEGQANQGN